MEVFTVLSLSNSHTLVIYRICARSSWLLAKAES